MNDDHMDEYLAAAPHYEPMTHGNADELMDAILDVVDAQPPDVRDRLRIAIKAGTYSLVAATPERLVINVHGIGELMVKRVRADA